MCCVLALGAFRMVRIAKVMQSNGLAFDALQSAMFSDPHGSALEFGVVADSSTGTVGEENKS
jgi:hypothetical protein